MRSIVAAAIATLAIAAGPAQAQDDDMAFGTEDDIVYTEQLWDVMEAERLAGPNMIRSFPYQGAQPHGMVLETFYSVETVDGHSGDLIVKRNYGPADVTFDEVLSDPSEHLGAYTVMFRREAGYDPDNFDWFWVRYGRDGAISTTGSGQPMAGKLQDACIACHLGAPDDLVFTSDHLIAN